VISVGDIVLYRTRRSDAAPDTWLPAIVVRKNADGSLLLHVFSDAPDPFTGATSFLLDDVTLGPEPGQWRHR
jgi:hypothetical protein